MSTVILVFDDYCTCSHACSHFTRQTSTTNPLIFQQLKHLLSFFRSLFTATVCNPAMFSSSLQNCTFLHHRDTILICISKKIRSLCSCSYFTQKTFRFLVIPELFRNVHYSSNLFQLIGREIPGDNNSCEFFFH